jgi:hypothetical protein
MLADMFIQAGKKKVLIVCSNEFLSYFGRATYGTKNVQGKKIEYISY